MTFRLILNTEFLDHVSTAFQLTESCPVGEQCDKVSIGVL